MRNRWANGRRASPRSARKQRSFSSTTRSMAPQPSIWPSSPRTSWRTSFEALACCWALPASSPEPSLPSTPPRKVLFPILQFKLSKNSNMHTNAKQYRNHKDHTHHNTTTTPRQQLKKHPSTQAFILVLSSSRLLAPDPQNDTTLTPHPKLDRTARG
jgi:hypothetical protein